MGILRTGSIKIERSLRKYPWGLIFKLFLAWWEAHWCLAKVQVGVRSLHVVPQEQPRGVLGGDGPGGAGGLFGPPIRPKNLKIRPPGYFFKLRSILMLPGLEIPLKSEKITKNRIYKRPGFQKMVKYWFELMSLYQFFTQNPNFKPKPSQNHPKTRFWPNFQKIRFL